MWNILFLECITISASGIMDEFWSRTCYFHNWNAVSRSVKHFNVHCILMLAALWLMDRNKADAMKNGRKKCDFHISSFNRFPKVWVSIGEQLQSHLSFFFLGYGCFVCGCHKMWLTMSFVWSESVVHIYDRIKLTQADKPTELHGVSECRDPRQPKLSKTNKR